MKLALILLVLSVASASAEEPIIGLLTLPEVLGYGPCDDFSPEEITLYSGMDKKLTSGVIKVDKFWTFPKSGGCEGLTVNTHMQNGNNIRPLLTKEYRYENPAAIILEAQNDWFRIKTASGSAWIQKTKTGRYISLEHLLENKMAYIKSQSGIKVFREPRNLNSVGVVSNSDSLNVIKTINVDNKYWHHIQVMDSSSCESDGPPKVLIEGWVPAHTATGKLTTWFYSRGC
jgi:hypothetical protein